MEHVRILFASPEAVPFIKTGGLADVAGMLPRVLADAGHTVTVALPLYSLIPDYLLATATTEMEFDVTVNDRSEPATIVSMNGPRPGLRFLFVGDFPLPSNVATNASHSSIRVGASPGSMLKRPVSCQYSSGMNSRISRSRSTTRRTATDCTRPALNPRATFFQSSGDT